MAYSQKAGVMLKRKLGETEPATGGAGPKKKFRKKGAPEKIEESQQYLSGNFRGALQEHLDRGGKTTNLAFTTEAQASDEKGPPKVFISKCTLKAIKDGPVASTEEGTGHGSNKKKSMQNAALDLIFKMNLLTPEQHVKLHPAGSAKAATPTKKTPGKKKPGKMTESLQYQKGNFRAALQEHLDKGGKTVKLNFVTTEQPQEDKKAPKVFISNCKLAPIKEGDAIPSTEEGIGHAGSKKKAVAYAALDLVLKMGLVTAEEHLKVHPATA